jgi:Kef-type K+ transport system membrane component KefB
MKDLSLGVHLFLQLVVIVAVCRCMGWLFKRLGQTQVVSEMIAGVMLGPSLLGAFLPEFQNWLFPKMTTLGALAPAANLSPEVASTAVKHPSMQILYVISQVGLALYMFTVGLEFDLNLLKKRAGAAISVSAAGIIAPFLFGLGVSFMLKARGDCFGPSVTATQGALYMGAAMCITAFPMLARIIYERGIAKTSMGMLALGAGAFDDMMAWCLLAVVLSMDAGTPTYAVTAIGGGIVYGIVTLTLGKRLMERVGRGVQLGGDLTVNQFAIAIGFLMLGSWFTDAIGIYAVFGAFIMGAAMPDGKFAESLKKRIEPLTVTLILPLFFIYSGLNTKIGLVNSAELWGVTALICVLAILGKGGACMLAAKAAGEPWRESAAIGTLMNARGLMELIILNIGLEHKVITPTLFTIMVIMAIVTTLMASPIFLRIYGGHIEKMKAQDALIPVQ